MGHYSLHCMASGPQLSSYRYTHYTSILPTALTNYNYIEDFWEAMSRVALSSYSDQGKMNYGLQAMSVEWSLPSYNLASITESVEGVGSSGLRVSLLPYSVACRGGSCTHTSLRPGLYIWHKGGARVGEKKREGIEEGRVWFLHSDWMNSCDVEQGKDWLKCIATDHEMFTSK